MNAYDPAGWHDFAGSVAGAAATLVGLVFVAISINLRAIVADRRLPGRAMHALVLLATPVFVCGALLIPQGAAALGVELLVVAGVTGPALGWLASARHRPPDTPVAGWVVGVVVPAVVLTAGLLVAGIGLLAHVLNGIFWLPCPVALAVLGGLFNAWVLMVEIVR